MRRPHRSAAFAKIKRAESDIQDLHTRIAAFYKAHPYEILSEVNAEGTEEVYYFRVGSDSRRSCALISAPFSTFFARRSIKPRAQSHSRPIRH